MKYEVANGIAFFAGGNEEIQLLNGMFFDENGNKKDPFKVAFSGKAKLNGIHAYGVIEHHGARTGDLKTISYVVNSEGEREFHFTTKEVPCYSGNKVVRVLPPSAFYFKLSRKAKKLDRG